MCWVNKKLKPVTLRAEAGFVKDSLGSVTLKQSPYMGLSLHKNYIVDYGRSCNFTLDLRVAKMLELNYVVCNNLIEKSEVETNYSSDNFENFKIIRVKHKGITLYISPDKCLFDPYLTPVYFDSFYLTEGSGEKIINEANNLLNNIHTMNLQPRSVE